MTAASTDPPDPPGPLIGVGRSADVYDVGGGRVLRRYRDPLASAEREAEVMSWVHDAGYPVPKVHDWSGPDLVMDRLEGPTLLSSIGARPWTLWSAGTLLADLHDRLHRIDASSLAASGVVGRSAGQGSSVVHLDLHPDNVVLSPDGPVVIDWANVAIGDGDYDVAYVWMVLTIARRAGPARQRATDAVGRRVLVASFLRRYDRSSVARALVGLVGEGAVSMRNFDGAELERLDRLVERAAERWAPSAP